MPRRLSCQHASGDGRRKTKTFLPLTRLSGADAEANGVKFEMDVKQEPSGEASSEQAKASDPDAAGQVKQEPPAEGAAQAEPGTEGAAGMEESEAAAGVLP